MLQNQCKQTHLKASKDPLNAINNVAYAGQPIERRLYQPGYESFFENIPVFDQEEGPFLYAQLGQAGYIMKALSDELANSSWPRALPPLDGGFNRTILAIEEPATNSDGTLKEGSEIILARWGDGHTSPVHGHADGFLYEQLLFGKMRVNTYRIIDALQRIVRPLKTEIFDHPATIASLYTNKSGTTRTALVHNFTSIGFSGTLHFVPEHTRDGRDNTFRVQYFDDLLYPSPNDFTQLTAQQGIEQLKIGDVALVHSENVSEYGIHYIVITGKPVLKEHGLRPQDIAIHTDGPNSRTILKYFEPIMGLKLLKLSPELSEIFLHFHGIEIKNGKVIFPE